jgi:hypothetical protein
MTDAQKWWALARPGAPLAQSNLISPVWGGGGHSRIITYIRLRLFRNFGVTVIAGHDRKVSGMPYRWQGNLGEVGGDYSVSELSFMPFGQEP